MDREPLGYYFHTIWWDGGRMFARRHDFSPTDGLAAKKAHDGAMTFLWADSSVLAQVGAMYDQYHRMVRHGVRRGEVRADVYKEISMPDYFYGLMATADCSLRDWVKR
jgi:hypothetical protein